MWWRTICSNHGASLVPKARSLTGIDNINKVPLCRHFGSYKVGRSALARFLLGERAPLILTGQNARYIIKRTMTKANDHFNVMSALFAKQCNALCAQKIRRTAQILNLYRSLGYDKHSWSQFISRLGNSLLRNRKGKPVHLLFGASLFAWNENHICEQEMSRLGEEIYLFENAGDTIVSNHLGDWEVVFDKPDLMAWRKPIPNTYLFEYKMYGTFRDLPARAFFNAQHDVTYRRQWDKLIIKLDVIEKDQETDSEVVQWIMHFPYPMYSREYVFVRRAKIYEEKKLMVLMSRATDHPELPVQEGKYVRVDSYVSHMVIQPHKSFDEDGFDFVLTYHDDPKSAFPSFAYNWIANKGVPEFVVKMHQAAKNLHESNKAGNWSSDQSDEEEDDKMSM